MSTTDPSGRRGGSAREDRAPERRGSRSVGRVASLTVGFVLAVGAPLWWVTADHTPAVEAIKPGAITRLAHDPGPQVGVPIVPVTGVGGTRLRPVTGLRPVRVRIPEIAVDTEVRAVGIAADGQLAIPDDIEEAGWFRWGSSPGSATGSVVLVGHLDSASQPGLGAFAYLRTLGAGAIVEVTTANGQVWRYRVIARESVVKSRLPFADLFSRGGRPRLTLLTCGGSFDAASASYDSTIVVTALPVRRR